MTVISAVAMDVDGVLTDGTFLWGPDGAESKSFSFRDIMGIARAGRAGLRFALITGESGELVDRLAAKLAITHVYAPCRDKAVALGEFAAAVGVPAAEICFIGDDVNDLPAFAVAGLSAAPADAHPEVLAAAEFVARAGGGHGAVREVVDHVLAACTAAPRLTEESC